MIPAEQLSNTFRANQWILERQLEGLSNAESFFQFPFQINCLNWVLGHIIGTRNRVLETLKKPPMWTLDERGFYKSGAPPITTVGQGLPLERLQTDLVLAQKQIAEALEKAETAFMMEIIDTFRGPLPRWQHISGLGWHETYHTGQVELFRQMILDSRENP